MLKTLDTVDPRKLTIRVRGFAASAHAILFSSSPGRREIERGATITFHRPTIMAMGDASEIEFALAMVRAADAEIRLRLIQRSGGTAADLLASGWDLTLSAEAAVDRGLADAVVDPGSF